MSAANFKLNHISLICVCMWVHSVYYTQTCVNIDDLHIFNGRRNISVPPQLYVCVCTSVRACMHRWLMVNVDKSQTILIIIIITCRGGLNHNILSFALVQPESFINTQIELCTELFGVFGLEIKLV